jgi:hypothetical protein
LVRKYYLVWSTMRWNSCWERIPVLELQWRIIRDVTATWVRSDVAILRGWPQRWEGLRKEGGMGWRLKIFFRKWTTALGQRKRYKKSKEEKDESDSCAICLLNYRRKELIIGIECVRRHHFHKKCFCRWMETSSRCPLDNTLLLGKRRDTSDK